MGSQPNRFVWHASQSECSAVGQETHIPSISLCAPTAKGTFLHNLGYECHTKFCLSSVLVGLLFQNRCAERPLAFLYHRRKRTPLVQAFDIPLVSSLKPFLFPLLNRTVVPPYADSLTSRRSLRAQAGSCCASQSAGGRS